MNTPGIILVIPARYGSMRFPGKPLTDIAGKTMIERVYDQAKQSRFAARVIVATDDQRIESKVKEFGGEALMTPSDIASGSERVAWIANKIEADIFVNIQGDEPLIPPETIDRTIEPMITNSHIDIGTAACRFTNENDAFSPDIVKVVRTFSGRALYFSRSPIPFQREAPASPVPHLKHVGIYAFRKSALEQFASLTISPLEESEKLEQLRALENDMYVHVALVGSDSIAIDTPEDVARVIDALKKKKTNRRNEE